MDLRQAKRFFDTLADAGASATLRAVDQVLAQTSKNTTGEETSLVPAFDETEVWQIKVSVTRGKP